MATWDGSQWWVFNVVLDWKLLYNAGVKSLLKIYTDQNQPKGVDMQSLPYKWSVKSQKPVGNRSGLVFVPSWGVICPVNHLCEQACIYYMKTWVKLIAESDRGHWKLKRG